jgi:hypothetical protein
MTTERHAARVRPGDPALSHLPAAGIVLVLLYIAAQMLSDVGSLKIALLAGFSIDVVGSIFGALPAIYLVKEPST